MTEPVRILLVEALPAGAELAEQEIRRTVPSCVFQLVDTQPDFLSALAAFQPHLIITDYQTSPFDGSTVLRLALAHDPLMPVIVLTRAMDEETAVACIKAGATDYITQKQITRLGTAVRQALEEAEQRRQNREVEEASKEKSEELEQFFTLTLDLLCIADTDGYFRRLNPRWETVLGYTLSELVGQNFLNLIHPDDYEETLAALNNLNAQESIVDFVNRYRCKDGSYRWIEWRSYPSGNLVYAAARDITERKLMEEALRESEFFLQKSQSVAQIGSYYLNVQTGQWLSSQTLDEIFGIDDDYPRDITSWISLIHPGHRIEMLGYLTKHVLSEHNRFDKQYQIIRHNDKQERWVHGLGEVELDENGQTIKMVGTIQDITERKQVGETLRESEERYRQLFELESDSLFLVDNENGRILEANNAALTLYGYSREEMLARKNTDLSAEPENTQQATQIEPPASDQVVTIPIRYHRKKDGTIFPVEITARFITQDGQSLHIAAIRDITDRLAAEERLRESEERLQRFTDVTTEGILFHHQGILKDVNPALTSMFGYQYDEVIGRKLVDFIAPESQNFVMQKVNQGEERPYEASGLRKDGTTFPLEIITRSYEFQGQNMRVACLRDITERKQTEAALQQSEERLRQAVHVARIGTFDHDHLADHIYFSPEYREMWGWGPKETVSLSRIIQQVHPEDLERVDAAVQQAHAPSGNGFYSIDHRIIHHDGTVRWLSVRSQTFFAGEGDTRHPVRTIGAAVNITEAKLAEIAQAELEERLRQAQKLESLGRLAGGIAHDFNNLLVPIIGYTELAQMKAASDSKLNSYLTKINTAAERAGSLVKQILAFSRRQMLEVQVLDLNEIVSEFKEMIQRLIGEDIELDLFLATAPCSIKADRSQIEQILLNLCINARDAMPDGGQLIIETGTVYLDEAYAQTRPEAQPGHHVMLSLSDTGHGMDEETKRHIFEPFFTTKQKGQGTGLGLATVFGIVKQHQGNIWVYSEPGQGSTFKIYLPRAKETTQMATTAVPDLPSVHGTETIMIVEDELMVRKLARETLEAYGYTIIETESPRDSLNIAATHEGVIHLLLTDVIMPDMNGRELYEEMVRIRPDIKVLYMSGYTDNVIVHHGVLDQDVNFLQKPFTVRNLAQKIRSILD